MIIICLPLVFQTLNNIFNKKRPKYTRKYVTDFLLVVNIVWSITHRFRVINNFLDFGGAPEVTLGGATRQILWPILKGDQRLTISD